MARASLWRLGLLVTIGLLLITSALALYRLFLLRPEGEGPAGPAVAREPFASPWTEREVVLLGLGDSITAGYGADTDKAFFAMLARNPPDEFEEMRGVCLEAVLPKLSVFNLAVSGSSSLQHQEKQLPELKPYPKETFGIVVMTTGGNDLIHWYGARPPEEGAMYGATLAQAQPWIASFKTRLDAMLGTIRAQFPGGCRIYLGNIYDPSDGGGDPRWIGLPPWPEAHAILDAYNAVLASAAEKYDDVVLVDIHGTFLGHGIRCAHFWRDFYEAEDPHYWYFQNIEDPNERGHDALRRVFLNAMAWELAWMLSGS